MVNNSGIEAGNTLSILEDLIDTKNIDKQSIKKVIGRLRYQITDMTKELNALQNKQ